MIRHSQPWKKVSHRLFMSTLRERFPLWILWKKFDRLCVVGVTLHHDDDDGCCCWLTMDVKIKAHTRIYALKNCASELLVVALDCVML